MLSAFKVDPSDFEVYEKDIYNDSYGVISLVHSKYDPYEKIALKRVTISEGRSQLTFFLRKIISMAQINHPCFIKLKGFSIVQPPKNDSLEKNDELYIHIYLPYMDNRNLNKLVREDFKREEKVLTPTQKTKIIYGIASAMSYLHKEGIIHRNLKLENILLDENFNPVIIYPDLTRIFDNNNMESPLESLYHMAPEIFSTIDDEYLTMKIDVYAFSVTLLSLFTDSLRFENERAKNSRDFAESLNNGLRFVIPEEVPEFYASLIQKCWDQNPENRPSFEEIVNDFEYNDDFMLDGSDAGEVRKFIDYILFNIELDQFDRDIHINQNMEFDFDD